FFSLFKLLYCFFFFFQAEDGIRDLTVTGVQTCALPIYEAVAQCNTALAINDRYGFAYDTRADANFSLGNYDAAIDDYTLAAKLRSEERRVGKECRARWVRDA